MFAMIPRVVSMLDYNPLHTDSVSLEELSPSLIIDISRIYY